jgi:hypothetical protein
MVSSRRINGGISDGSDSRLLSGQAQLYFVLDGHKEILGLD